MSGDDRVMVSEDGGCCFLSAPSPHLLGQVGVLGPEGPLRPPPGVVVLLLDRDPLDRHLHLNMKDRQAASWGVSSPFYYAVD